MKEKEILICACHSFEHQAIFYYDEEEDFYIYIYPVTHGNFVKKIWVAIKYVYGYESRYGQFDEFILNNDDKKRLIKFLQQPKK